MIRVLVAEDSNTARELLIHVLRSDREIEVVGEAKNGIEAIELTQKLRPALVTMDIRMPRLDGLAATKHIMVESPTPIVIVSALGAEEVETSLSALRSGALAVLEKLPAPEAPEFEQASRQLIETVKAIAGVRVVRRRADSRQPVAPRPRLPDARGRACPARIVAIGASTGGPAALASLLSWLPGDFPVPILVVQHMARGFTAGLARWLGGSSRLIVKVAEHDEILAPRTVYLAPDDLHLGVTRGARIALSAGPRIGLFRPSATHLFDSVAAAYGASAVALIMTGMGSDGVAGLRSVREAGGRVVAQDEASCVVFGMPRCAVEAGVAQAVLPLERIPVELMGAVGCEGGPGQ